MNYLKFSFALLLLLLTISSGYTQTNVIKVDMFGLVQQRKSFSFERSIKNKFSVSLSYENQIYNSGENTNGQTIYEVHGKGIIPEVRWYPFNKKKPAPLGFYMGSSFRYITVTEKYGPSNINLEGQVFNYTLVTGYKSNYERVIFDFLIGYGSGKIKGFDNQDRSLIDPFFSGNTLDDLKAGFRFEVSLGFYFPKMKDE